MAPDETAAGRAGPAGPVPDVTGQTIDWSDWSNKEAATNSSKLGRSGPGKTDGGEGDAGREGAARAKSGGCWRRCRACFVPRRNSRFVPKRRIVALGIVAARRFADLHKTVRDTVDRQCLHPPRKNSRVAAGCLFVLVCLAKALKPCPLHRRCCSTFLCGNPECDCVIY